MNIFLDRLRAQSRTGYKKRDALRLLYALVVLFSLWALARPSYRIISRTEMLNFEGVKVYMIDWTDGGRMSMNAVFYTPEARSRFVNYLRWHGWVEE
jgi:hypothetical protein